MSQKKSQKENRLCSSSHDKYTEASRCKPACEMQSAQPLDPIFSANGSFIMMKHEREICLRDFEMEEKNT